MGPTNQRHHVLNQPKNKVIAIESPHNERDHKKILESGAAKFEIETIIKTQMRDHSLTANLGVYVPTGLGSSLAMAVWSPADPSRRMMLGSPSSLSWPWDINYHRNGNSFLGERLLRRRLMRVGQVGCRGATATERGVFAVEYEWSSGELYDRLHIMLVY